MSLCELGYGESPTIWLRMRSNGSGNPTSDRVEDLHFVRVTKKRLRAILRLIRPAIKKTAFDRENGRLRTAARRLSIARDADVARQTLATLPFKKQSEMDSAAAALAGFRKNGVPEADISKTMKVTALDLDQTRRNLHRLRFRDTNGRPSRRE